MSDQAGVSVEKAAKARRAPLMTRLAYDRAGNTLAIVGAALLPLTAMIGSGVDMSRAYMAKTRLQSACDAAALAGRRVMIGDTLDANVTNEAIRFFNFNFAQGMYGTANFTPTVTRPSVGTVRVEAETTIPTTVMNLFGFTTIDLEVECDATQNFVNTDVLLVLDTTGSMLCTPEQPGNCGQQTETPQSRIVALREAVMALYDALRPTQTQLEGAGMRLRYGVVPYSSTVNVGALLNPAHIADTATYQSRRPIYSTTPIEYQVFTQNNYDACMDAATLNEENINWSSAPINGSWTYWEQRSGDDRCHRISGNFTLDQTPHWSYTFYHQPVAHDTSQFKTFSTNVPLPTRDVGSNTMAARWNGCIEERQTVSSITAASGFTIPSGAHDLDINMIPSSDATRWKPQWSEVTYHPYGYNNGGFYRTTDPTRFGGRPGAACPAPARRLQAWNRSDMQTYVDNLVAQGGTYHDIGMIWGARMISSAGVFADSPNTHNNMPVAKHIVFMTDGELAPTEWSYTAYGTEGLEERVTGAAGAPQQYDRHMQRFRMMCNAAKGMNVSVWVIVFGGDLSLSPQMLECASNPEQAALASNKQQLIDKFTEIGQNIGALRLVQ